MKNNNSFTYLYFCKCSFLKTYRMETSNRILKADLMELSDIKYGMFNVDVWKEKIAVIISKKVEELEINEKNKEEKTEVKLISFLKNNHQF